MSSAAFQAARQTGIGGSDIATIFGVNPYCTKLELYLQKRGEIEPKPDNAHTRAGRIFEAVVATLVAERTGCKLRRIRQTLRHPTHDFLIGHVDRVYADEPKGLEIKNVGARMAWRWGKDGEPEAIDEHYLPQVHHYMMLLDYPAFDVAAYFGGADLRIYPVERDPEMDELIISAASDFWHKHVLAGVPPEPEYDHPTTLPMLQRLHAGTNGAKVEADEMIMHWAKVAQDAANKAAEYEKTATTAKNHLLAFMGDAAVLELGGGCQFRRKRVQRKGYAVADSSYIDARFVTSKE